MKMNDFADVGKTNPIKPNFKGKKMLLRKQEAARFGRFMG